MNLKPHLKQSALLALGFSTAFGLGTVLPLRAGTITNDLVVYLPFDNTYDNLAPSTVTAEPKGSPTFGTGTIGAGAVAVSNDPHGAFFNYVSLGTPPELNFAGDIDITLSLWVKLTTWTGDPSFISNKDWGSGDHLGYVLATAGGGGYQWNYTDGGGRKDYDGPGGTLNDGHWHHIAASFDRTGNAVTYLDGNLVNTQTAGPGGGTLDTGLPTNIGQDGTGGYTDGANGVSFTDALIDDVAVWRRALSAVELARIYQFGTNGVPLNLIPDPAAATLVSVNPPDKAINILATTAISAVVLDGALPLDTATVQMTVNDAPVVPTFTKVDRQTTISYQPPVKFASASTNKAHFQFGTGASLVSSNWSFVIVDSSQSRGITGQWDFEAGTLAATVGLPLEYRDGTTGQTAQGTKFGSTTELGIPPINGLPAKVMGIPAALTRNIGYIMRHGALPNGDPAATKVNQWTIIMDILIPHAVDHQYFSFMQIDDPIANGDDGDLFAQFSGNVAGIGIGGDYQGNLTGNEWHRVAFAVDNIGPTPVISKWIDGVKAEDQSRDAPQLNGRHSLFPTISLFSDEDGESEPAFLNSIQIRNYKMSDASLTALGGPSSQGVPRVVGQWDFDAGNLAATVGADLGMLPDTELFSGFESTVIDAGTANVLSWFYKPEDVASAPLGFVMPVGALPNGVETKVNQYTLIMDILFPASSTGYRALLQTGTNNTEDSELFVHPSNAIGISSQYQGALTPDTWHRVAFTFDLTKRELGKYIDGANVLTGPVGSDPLGTGPYQYLSSGVDGRFALETLALLFSDEDGEINPGSVNSIQLRSEVLTPAQIAILGKATAAGIPVNLPEPPVLRIETTIFGPTISWPTAFTDYILESSPRLGPTADWQPVDGVGDHLYEEFRLPAPGFFYRLRRQ